MWASEWVYMLCKNHTRALLLTASELLRSWTQTTLDNFDRGIKVGELLRALADPWSPDIWFDCSIEENQWRKRGGCCSLCRLEIVVGNRQNATKDGMGKFRQCSANCIYLHPADRSRGRAVVFYDYTFLRRNQLRNKRHGCQVIIAHL